VVTRICLSVASCLHYCPDPDVTWGSGRGCPLVAAVVLRPPQRAAADGGVCESYFFYISIGDLATPMFQQALMLPIFSVGFVHRPNPNQKSTAAASLTVMFPHFSGGFSSHDQCWLDGQTQKLKTVIKSKSPFSCNFTYRPTLFSRLLPLALDVSADGLTWDALLHC